jgi:hypothetical protein
MERGESRLSGVRRTYFPPPIGIPFLIAEVVVRVESFQPLRSADGTRVPISSIQLPLVNISSLIYSGMMGFARANGRKSSMQSIVRKRRARFIA